MKLSVWTLAGTPCTALQFCTPPVRWSGLIRFCGMFAECSDDANEAHRRFMQKNSRKKRNSKNKLGSNKQVGIGVLGGSTVILVGISHSLSCAWFCAFQPQKTCFSDKSADRRTVRIDELIGSRFQKSCFWSGTRRNRESNNDLTLATENKTAKENLKFWNNAQIHKQILRREFRTQGGTRQLRLPPRGARQLLAAARPTCLYSSSFPRRFFAPPPKPLVNNPEVRVHFLMLESKSHLSPASWPSGSPTSSTHNILATATCAQSLLFKVFVIQK